MPSEEERQKPSPAAELSPESKSRLQLAEEKLRRLKDAEALKSAPDGKIVEVLDRVNADQVHRDSLPAVSDKPVSSDPAVMAKVLDDFRATVIPPVTREERIAIFQVAAEVATHLMRDPTYARMAMRAAAEPKGQIQYALRDALAMSVDLFGMVMTADIVVKPAPAVPAK